MNLEKLKDTARKFEQKEDWRKAIEVYLKAIQHAESGAENQPDLSLYNRVGDLYLKINDTADAVRSYERAVDLYADQGFFNNAIALCGKILRVNPGRTQTYLKLCQLHARKNVVSEAKRNLIEFLERMNALGPARPGVPGGQALCRPVLRQPGDPQHAGRAAPGHIPGRRSPGTAGEDGAGPGGLRRQNRSPEDPRPDCKGSSPEHSPQPAAPAPPHSRRGGDLIFLDTGVDVPTAPPRAGPSPPRDRPKRLPGSFRNPPRLSRNR